MDEPPLGHGEPYRPLGRRALILTILLIIGIATAIASLVSEALQSALIEEARRGHVITPQQLEDNDRRQLIVSVTDGAVYAATIVFFLVWLHRAYRNLDALGGDRRWGTGWAIGGWFVPILRIWRPKQIVNDIWRESGPRTTDEYGTKDEGNRVPNLFLAWWLLWLLMDSLFWGAVQVSWDAETLEDLEGGTGLFILADLASIVTAVLAVLLVQRATAREEERARMLDLIPDDDRTAIVRRKSTWVVLVCLVLGVALQGGIASSAGTDLVSAKASGPSLVPATQSGTLVSDNFFTAGLWLVEDDSDVTFEVVDGAYRIFLKRPGLWSSVRPLPQDVESLSMDADASAETIDLKTDLYGISCLTASGESFEFGMSPDGYYTVAYDPGGDQNLEFQTLTEEYTRRRFSPTRAKNRLRAECVREGDVMNARFFVNGTRLTETKHESTGRLVGVELFVYSENGGTDIRFDNVFVRSLSQ